MTRLRGLMPWPAAPAALGEIRALLEAVHSSSSMQAARKRTDGGSCRAGAVAVAFYIRTGILHV